MNYLQAIFLGVLQGVTEFLPVSSSGHLVIVQSLLPGFSQPGILFDVVLHLATTLAVLVYFREKILRLTKDYTLLLVVGTIPAGLAGILFQDFFESLFSSLWLAGVTLIITGVLNYFTDRFTARRQNVTKVDAILVGVAQAVAIVPGISRSGSTIFAGTALGIERRTIAEFSFILSVPAILGAGLMQVITHGINGDINIGVYMVGSVFAFLAAIVSIGVLLRFLMTRGFKFFAIYCVVIGVVAIALA